MEVNQLMDSSRPFLEWLVKWSHSRPLLELDKVLQEAGGAEKAAILAVDVITGFCTQGPLASERVGRIVEPIVRLFERAHELGVHHFLLPQDAHSPEAVEFVSYGAHCVGGTSESETVPELKNLPFSDRFTIFPKNSISSALGTGLDSWLEAHPEVTVFVVVGDCTDLCTYQLAMHLRLKANAFNRRGVRVILPMDGVDTFDVPVEMAEKLGIMPHHGDLLHLVFLYSMAQNGVEVVARVV
ncbi:MAG: cysteine hydrolase family protein [Anaerolineae bacterium]